MRLFWTILLFPLIASAQLNTNTPWQVLTYSNITDVLTRASPLNVNRTYYTMGRITPNDGGGGELVYDPTSSATTNRGVIFRFASANGRVIRPVPGALNVKWFGAYGDGFTDDTTAIQDAINYAATTKGTVFFPSGTYLHQGLLVYNAVKLRGNGVGRDSTTNTGNTILKYTGSSVAIQNGTTNAVFDFGISDMQLLGTDGNGGTALLLDSFQYASVQNVNIGKFRNAGKAGRGIARLCAYAINAFNYFSNIQIEDSDTALYSDATTAHSVGYSTFVGITVYQQGTVIDARNTAGNGSINDAYFNLEIQGDNTTTNDYIYMQGRDNKFYGITIDAPGSGYFVNEDQANASGNEYYFNSAPDETQFRSIQTIGKRAIVGGAGLWSYSFGRTFQMFQPGAATELSLLSDDDNAVELHFGNSTAGSQAWRWTMDSGTNTPSLRLRNTSGGGLVPMNVSYSDGSIDYSGSATYRNSKPINMISATNAVSEAVLNSTSANNVQLLGFSEGGSTQIGTRNENSQTVLLSSNLTVAYFDKQGLSVVSNIFVGVGGTAAGYITQYGTNSLWPHYLSVDPDGKWGFYFGSPGGLVTNLMKLDLNSGYTGAGTKILFDDGIFHTPGYVNAAGNVGSGAGVIREISGSTLLGNSIIGTNGGNMSLTVSSNGNVLVITPVSTNFTVLAISDPATTLTTSATNYFTIPASATLKYVTGTLLIPSSSGSVTNDLTKNGTTVLSAPMVFAAGATNATGTLSVTSVAALDRLMGTVSAAGTTAYGLQLVIGYTIP